MDIKEIALKAGYSTVPAYWLSDEKPIACSTSNLERLVSFAEALIAEIAKQNEPLCTAAMLDEWFLSKSGVDPKLPRSAEIKRNYDDFKRETSLSLSSIY